MFNIAIGGNSGGLNADNACFPATAEVDWSMVCQKK